WLADLDVVAGIARSRRACGQENAPEARVDGAGSGGAVQLLEGDHRVARVEPLAGIDAPKCDGQPVKRPGESEHAGPVRSDLEPWIEDDLHHGDAAPDEAWGRLGRHANPVLGRLPRRQPNRGSVRELAGDEQSPAARDLDLSRPG